MLRIGLKINKFKNKNIVACKKSAYLNKIVVILYM
jgi:hypothetical protein